MTKPKRLLEWLKRGEATTPYLLVADSWDIVFAESPEAILEEYQNFEADLVLNAEKNCFPLGHLADRFPDQGTPYRYLNSGFIIGRTEAFVTMLEHMYAHNIPAGYNTDDHRKPDGGVEHPNDQGFITLAYLDQPVVMKLDVRGSLCHALCGVEAVDFSSSGIRNIETGVFPKAFHFNGSAKTSGLREPILKHLNL